MKIRIIGGSGFIGTWLTKKLLLEGHRIRIIDKVQSAGSPEICSDADVRDLESLKNTIDECDVVINLAAEHKDNVRPRELYEEVNVKGAENVCHVLVLRNIDKLIFTSSVAVYGFAPPNTTEEGKYDPFNDYGRTKMLAEKIYEKWVNAASNRSLTIIRPTVVFGENNRGNVFNLLHQMASGKFIMVGRGENRKSMAYVENVAAFIEYSMSMGEGMNIFNYIDKPDYSMNDLVMLVRKTLGHESHKLIRLPYFIGYLGGACFDLLSLITRKKYPVSAIRVKKFCTTTQYNSENIRNTDFTAPIPIEEGLINTVRHEFMSTYKTGQPIFYSE